MSKFLFEKGHITQKEIDKPFSTHEETLKELYVIRGFRELMESLIECIRRDIADKLILNMEELRFKQGELATYKKFYERAKKAFEKIEKPKDEPLSE